MADGLSGGQPIQVFSDGTVNPTVQAATGAFPVVTRTRVQVVGGAASVLLLGKNEHRIGAIIDNPIGNPKMLISMGIDAATPTDFTTELAAGDQYEVPFGYTGSIYIYNPGGGLPFVYVTEFTPGNPT